MIPTLRLTDETDRNTLGRLLQRLRLDVRSLLLDDGELSKQSETVRRIMADVVSRGDAAIVEITRNFDDADFDASRIVVSKSEMKQAADRIDSSARQAIRRSIANVRAYQSAVMPAALVAANREGVELGLRHTPVDSAGLYVPGGKASYPSSLIMLAVPAQAAGVKRIAVCTPATRYGQNDLLLAAAYELGIDELFRVGGPAAIAALAAGTQTIRPVDVIAGPGNSLVQLAKRLASGAVGVDGFYGPSEILVFADDSADAACVAADMIAQAEHDPGRCFLLTADESLAKRVVKEIENQVRQRSRNQAIDRALADGSAIVIGSNDELIELANTIAAEHVSVQVRDADALIGRLRHAGAIFVGRFSPVAAGDYVAGPSHSLPTNTTARFSSGVSVYTFLKRASVVRYKKIGLDADADAIIAMAKCEGLDAHAASVEVRSKHP